MSSKRGKKINTGALISGILSGAGGLGAGYYLSKRRNGGEIKKLTEKKKEIEEQLKECNEKLEEAKKNGNPGSGSRSTEDKEINDSYDEANTKIKRVAELIKLTGNDFKIIENINNSINDAEARKVYGSAGVVHNHVINVDYINISDAVYEAYNNYFNNVAKYDYTKEKISEEIGKLDVMIADLKKKKEQMEGFLEQIQNIEKNHAASTSAPSAPPVPSVTPATPAPPVTPDPSAASDQTGAISSFGKKHRRSKGLRKTKRSKGLKKSKRTKNLKTRKSNNFGAKKIKKSKKRH